MQAGLSCIPLKGGQTSETSFHDNPRDNTFVARGFRSSMNGSLLHLLSTIQVTFTSSTPAPQLRQPFVRPAVRDCANMPKVTDLPLSATEHRNADQAGNLDKRGSIELAMAEEMAWLNDLPYYPNISSSSLTSRQRLRRVLVGLLIPLVTLVMICLTLQSHLSPPVRRFQPSDTHEDELPRVLYLEDDVSSKPKIVIFQHTLPTLSYQDLIAASINGHIRYGQAHGYRHQIDGTLYVVDADTQGSYWLNKLYALKELVQAELVKGENACEWIWSAARLAVNSVADACRMTDIDTVIVNPTIPIHHLLPPSTFEPPPLMIGNQDKAGFNAGSVLYHLEPALLDLIEFSFDVVRQHLEYHSFPSDQYVIHRALLDHSELGERFYEIPQFWTNPYEDYKNFNVLQYHLVCGLKFTEDWGLVVKEAEAVWEQARLVGDGDEALGVKRMGWSGDAAKMGVDWWNREGQLNGIVGLGFSGI
jgi:hypothetical protein